MEIEASFWKGRRVLVTGHTGFKGGWLSLWLADLEAQVFGLALAPDTAPSLFAQLGLATRIDHAVVDLRDAAGVAARVRTVAPEVVFHLAAQPLVRRSYAEPVATWSTNVMGTINLLDALRQAALPCAVVVATTDKVYQNREWAWGYREADRLGGHDPYSASKAATEIAVASYRSSFFGENSGIRVATARAGNVIGGGDWAADRIVPDLVRAFSAGAPVAVRNPNATRPWQHVLEPLAGYLALAEGLATGRDLPPAINFGPDAGATRSVRALMEAAVAHWPGTWNDASTPGAAHEAARLALAIDLAAEALNWRPRWGFETAVATTIAWYRAVAEGGDPVDISRAQIRAYEAAA